MAMADYYHCDACGGKAFYDADIDDRFERVAMTVLCERCTKRYVIEIRERAAPPRGESEDTARLDTEWLIDQREHARAKRAEYRSDEPPQGDPAQQMAYWRGYDDALGQVMARRVNLRDAARAPAPSAPQEPRDEPWSKNGHQWVGALGRGLYCSRCDADFAPPGWDKCPVAGQEAASLPRGGADA